MKYIQATQDYNHHEHIDACRAALESRDWAGTFHGY